MKYPRLAIYSALICLPAVVIVAVGGWLVVDNVPRLVRYEPIRIGREYREVAETLRNHPDRATYRGERRKGWRQAGKLDGMPWGYVTDGSRTLVWHQVGSGRYHAQEIAAISQFPYALVGYGGSAFIALVLIGLSALSVTYLYRTVRERDDFLAATAHDLTTPLVGMRMTIDRNPEEAKRLNERMLLIVANLKDFLRLGRRRTPTLAPVDLVQTCRDAYQLFREDYRDILGGDVPISGDAVPPALADATLVTQIFWNLFGNDLKYAAPYGRVSVGIGAADGRVLVEFVDDGQGMTPRQLRHAFDRYYRAKTAMESGKGGFGIGLCTSREFARLMGGELSVRANAPSGCVFALSLPVANMV